MKSGTRNGAEIGMFEGIAHAVAEIREKLADHEQQKDEPAEPGERLGDGVDAVDHTGDRLGADAIGGADRQKHQHDQHTKMIPTGPKFIKSRSA
jgi:hypothetical protein